MTKEETLPNNQTLWNFVRLQPRFKQMGDLYYIFEYNEVMCAGVKTIMPNTEELRIMPLLSSDDIGNGAGQSVFKSFKRSQPIENEQQNKP